MAKISDDNIMIPTKDTPIDTRIIVRDRDEHDSAWRVRCFAGIGVSGGYLAWHEGLSSSMSRCASEWDYARIVDPNFKPLPSVSEFKQLKDEVAQLTTLVQRLVKYQLGEDK